MKNILLVLSVLLLISCGSETNQNMVTLDLTASYPKKILVLQDIADVQYVQFETNEEAKLSNSVTLNYDDEDVIVLTNRIEGDIFIYDGTGKLISHFNHKGNSAKEYIRASSVVYDKSAEEVFVLTVGKPQNKFLVYNLKGEFLRELPLKSKDILGSLYNFDKKNIIAYEKPNYSSYTNGKRDSCIVVRNKTPMFLISKQTGAIDTIKDFYVENRQTDAIIKKDKGFAFYSFFTNSVTETKDGFVLDNMFCDKIYLFTRDRELIPILKKTPSFESMDKTKFVVSTKEVCSKYLFATVNHYTTVSKRIRDKNLCINRTNDSIIEYRLQNKDIGEKYFNVKPVSSLLRVADLKVLMRRGKLRGQLKEIAKEKDANDRILVKVTIK